MFRKPKQKRFIRRKKDEAPSLSEHALTLQEHPVDDGSKYDTSQEPGTMVTKITKRAKGERLGREGMVFTNVASTYSETTALDENDIQRGLTTPRHATSDRFATQSFQRNENLDKHMIAYIEDRLATANPPRLDPRQGLNTAHERSDSQIFAKVSGQTSRQPAGLGKIQEIDLGPDSTLRNIARTKAATQDFMNVDRDVSSDKLEGKSTFVGHDGKPRKFKKRRNSEDIHRDRLVEEVLRESKLDLYNESEGINGTNADEAADDRIAEEFRKEFMDAIISRNYRRNASANQAANKKKAKADEKPRGPKLGGSRSARAAMRARENKK